MTKRIVQVLAVCVMTMTMLLVSGCSQNVMDTYSFGHQVIRLGQSEITVALPYELGKDNQISTDNQGRPAVKYGALTEHMLIDIEGVEGTATVPVPTVQSSVDFTKAQLAKTGTTVQVSDINLNGVTAKKLTATYANNGRQLSFLQYIFVDKNVLWNIVYQHPSDDALGNGIQEQIENKIVVTQKKEG